MSDSRFAAYVVEKRDPRSGEWGTIDRHPVGRYLGAGASDEEAERRAREAAERAVGGWAAAYPTAEYRAVRVAPDY